MIRVERSDEPARFEADVRVPGQAWLASHPSGRPPSGHRYWNRVLPEMQAAFQGRCAWSATFLAAEGQIDHFVPIQEDRSSMFEWANYRYASSRVNALKGAVRSDRILDPFEVEDEWFELLLPSCQVVLSPECPEEVLERARFTLDRLQLGNGEHAVRGRRSWLACYEDGALSLEQLQRFAPMVARAVIRHGHTVRGAPEGPPVLAEED